MTRWETIEGTRVLFAGKGEWYNQPHDKPWDMGEDTQDLPTPKWHIEVMRACEGSENQQPRLVVDVSEMSWLIGHDWGFLVRVSDILSEANGELVLVAGERISGAASTLQLESKIRIVDALGKAL